MTDETINLKTVGNSTAVTIPNGVTVYVWWKDKGTVRITATPVDFMFDIKSNGKVKKVKMP